MHFQKNLKHILVNGRESIKIIHFSPPSIFTKSIYLLTHSDSKDKDAEVWPLFRGRMGSMIHNGVLFTFVSWLYVREINKW